MMAHPARHAIVHSRGVAAVVAQLGERIDLVLDGGPARGGTPSTVVDCTGEAPKVLRLGAISAGLLVEALEYELGSASANVRAGKARAVAMVGLDAAVEAARRLLEQAASIEEWESPDFWAFDLGRVLGSADPELGWEFVCRIVEVVSDQARPLAGAGELEDFCWAAAPAFIERIEEQARRSQAFREALGSVWPGGDSIPPAIYARIRAAATSD